MGTAISAGALGGSTTGLHTAGCVTSTSQCRLFLLHMGVLADCPCPAAVWRVLPTPHTKTAQLSLAPSLTVAGLCAAGWGTPASRSGSTTPTGSGSKSSSRSGSGSLGAPAGAPPSGASPSLKGPGAASSTLTVPVMPAGGFSAPPFGRSVARLPRWARHLEGLASRVANLSQERNHASVASLTPRMGISPQRRQA